MNYLGSSFLKKYFGKQIMIEEYGYNLKLFGAITQEQIPDIEKENYLHPKKHIIVK